MQNGHPVPQQEDHKSILAAIEAAYLDMISASTTLQSHLQRGRGPIEMKFIPFYDTFTCFFSLTSIYRDLDRHRDLVERIDAWVSLKTKITPQRAEIGLGLMREYQRAVASELLPLRK